MPDGFILAPLSLSNLPGRWQKKNPVVQGRLTVGECRARHPGNQESTGSLREGKVERASWEARDAFLEEVSPELSRTLTARR